MMQWDIEPFVGAGLLKFDMSRTAARELLAEYEWTKGNTFDSKHTRDIYVSLGVGVEFDSDIFVLIEGYTSTSAPWVFDGISIFEHDVDSLSAMMLDRGIAASHGFDEGCCFESIGLTVCQPRIRDKIATVGLHSRSEFDTYLRVVREIDERKRERALGTHGPRPDAPVNPFLRGKRDV